MLSLEEPRYIDSIAKNMSLKRDVSPIGASRFERPYEPPSGKNSAATSPTTPSNGCSPFHFSKPSVTSTAETSPNHFSKPSVTSTAETYSTAPTSIEALEFELKGISEPICVLPEEPDEWFDKFPNNFEPDPYLEETDDCPDRATFAAVQEMPIYDAEGNSRAFGSLYEPEEATHQRQLIIFIRYFFCPACTLYVKALTEGISTEDYFNIPVPTSIVIIGCGQPDLIAQYKKFTGCPFPMYAEPTRVLFKKLGMGISLNVGRQRPEYMGAFGLLGGSRQEMIRIRKSLKEPDGLRKRDLLRGGNPMQIGGEFLFEGGEVLWCHRMTNYRNHAEIRYLRSLLQLDE